MNDAHQNKLDIADTASGIKNQKLFITGLEDSYSMLILESVSLKEDVDVIFEPPVIAVEFCVTLEVTFDWVVVGNDVDVVFEISFNSEVVIEEACVKSIIYLELIVVDDDVGKVLVLYFSFNRSI